MNDLFVFVLVILITIPGLYFLLRYFFKESLLFKVISLNMILLNLGLCIGFAAGEWGVKSLWYGMPLLGGAILWSLVYIKRSVQQPLINVVHQVNLIAEGNLDMKAVKELKKDKYEIGVLVSVVQKLSFVLKCLVKEIKKSSKELKIYSDVLNDSTHAMSSGTDQQIVSSQELTSTIKVMLKSIEDNGTHAIESKRLSNKNVEKLTELSTLSEKINHSVEVISKNTYLINKIAERTNILSINAAVEGARAGEVGRGFSVVAKEVSKLADSCREASLMITKASKDSKLLVDQSALLYEEMLPYFNAFTSFIEKIHEASIDQSSGVEQITKVVSELNEVVQVNGNTSLDIARASDSLKEVSERLNDSLDFFDVKSSIVKKDKRKTKETMVA